MPVSLKVFLIILILPAKLALGFLGADPTGCGEVNWGGQKSAACQGDDGHAPYYGWNSRCDTGYRRVELPNGAIWCDCAK